MTECGNQKFDEISGCFFEDIIDGYFPLKVSLAQMMRRNSFEMALLTLNHAPIIDVPDLPPEAPVPLNIRAGRAGMIDQMTLWTWWSAGDLQMAGNAQWRFWTGEPGSACFDPMTRLAEPAFLRGLGILKNEVDPVHRTNVASQIHRTRMAKLIVDGGGAQRRILQLNTQGWANPRFWGPMPIGASIVQQEAGSARVSHDFGDRNGSSEMVAGAYLLTASTDRSATQHSARLAFEIDTMR